MSTQDGGHREAAVAAIARGDYVTAGDEYLHTCGLGAHGLKWRRQRWPDGADRDAEGPGTDAP